MLLGGPKNSLAVTSLSSQLLWQFSELPSYSQIFLHFRIVACCSVPLTSDSSYFVEFLSKSVRNSAPSLTISLDYLLIYRISFFISKMFSFSLQCKLSHDRCFLNCFKQKSFSIILSDCG